MSELKIGDDKLLKELEKHVLEVLKSRKSTKADKLAAINAGTRLAAIRHKINGSGDEEEKGFFSK